MTGLLLNKIVEKYIYKAIICFSADITPYSVP
jgi:hypothetical protein